ncbi:MAG: rhamnulose-1-phosphate aldolase [Alphaproteobacteria bacterium]|nr:rhamnulose-1-phosphate aldolase [Alphaproteobacteria bacterium]MDE2112442.1 rhamnulose-1-phosphate aldolase [Alphaproteobacteria bacterium]MDE2494055.1 rhamnulose-1-phosphate aldolase [Alphaproteobacteria bacterium]
MRAPPDQPWFVTDMIRVASDMWTKGWDERNGGNVSYRLLESDVAPYLEGWTAASSPPLSKALPEIAGQYYLVTGSGKYFRNIAQDPEANLGVIRIGVDGRQVELLWGYRDGGVPTSELPAHLKSHRARQADTHARVIMHCHATNLIALSYVLELNSANVTRALWEGSTECLVVFPDGVGALSWMVPGTDAIGDATAELLRKHSVVLWPFHGVFATGETLGEAFGLIETVEKSAEMLVKIVAMGGARQTISTQNLIALARRFDVVPMPEALALDGWRLADGTHDLSNGNVSAPVQAGQD